MSKKASISLIDEALAERHNLDAEDVGQWAVFDLVGCVDVLSSYESALARCDFLNSI